MAGSEGTFFASFCNSKRDYPIERPARRCHAAFRLKIAPEKEAAVR
jgi:hypothetical protein